MDPKEKVKYGQCPFPDCQRRPLPGKSPHGFCIEHEKFVGDLLFILPHIQFTQSKKPSGLIVPGSPEFSILPRKVRPK